MGRTFDALCCEQVARKLELLTSASQSDRGRSSDEHHKHSGRFAELAAAVVAAAASVGRGVKGWSNKADHPSNGAPQSPPARDKRMVRNRRTIRGGWDRGAEPPFTTGDNMRTKAQNEASRRNGARSRGPVTEEGKARARFNRLDTGYRAESLILPGEDPLRFETQLGHLVDDYQPRNVTEYRLLHEIAVAEWTHQRVERAQFERLKTYINSAEDRADLEVAGDLEKLFSHPAGPQQLYGLTRPFGVEPPNSASGSGDDPNKPAAVLKRLEGSAKGCQALLDTWKFIASRIENDVEIQSHDRPTKLFACWAGKRSTPSTIGRVALIFLASFSCAFSRRLSPLLTKTSKSDHEHTGVHPVCRAAFESSGVSF